MKQVSVLGATGSIGTSTLDVIARHPERYSVFALSANTQHQKMVELCQQFGPKYAVMADADAAQRLTDALSKLRVNVDVLAGVEGLEFISSHRDVDYVMAAIVGAAGLQPALAAARSGKRILLANKEALVMSGRLFMEEVSGSGAELLPIDSEHNAIFQCMPRQFADGLKVNGVEKILLTASGGPFRTLPLEQLSGVTPEQAVAHPNWSMGRKISVDSATMMNKGLEVIEACWLFNATVAQIQVVIHPQSVIHSMVSYSDGSVLAELGNPDMRTPIAHAMAWPERIESGVASLDIFDIARLDFEAPDLQRFPCLRLAMEAMSMGGTASTILNAANEIAVDEFLQGHIRFTDIARVIEHCLQEMVITEVSDLNAVHQADADAREVALGFVGTLG